MADNQLNDENMADDSDDRKIDWPVLGVRLPPDVFEAVAVVARARGKKPGPWARDLITDALAEEAA